MEITNIEAIPIEAGVEPKENEGGIAPYITSVSRIERSQRMLVRLETDTGTTGWGEFMIEMDPIAMQTLIEREIAPNAIGRPAWQIEKFVNDYFYYYVDIKSLLGPVEMAMWDAFGKELGAPVHQLLGGKCRDAVDLSYCVGILDIDEAREHARYARDEGFSVLKTKGGRDWKHDVKRMIAMHDEVDGDLEFRLDANQAYSFEEAVRVGATLEDAGVYLEYLEQPVQIGTYGSYKRLRERLRQPIGPNDDTYFSQNLYHLIQDDAADVGVVDCVPSGITGTKQLAGIAQESGVTLIHHCGFDLGIKTAAMLHIVSSTPAFSLPSDTIYYAWSEHILKSPFKIEGGQLPIPDGPGLGIEVNEDQVESLRIDG